MLFSEELTASSFHALTLEIEGEGRSKIKGLDLKKAYFEMFRDLIGKILLWADVRKWLLRKRR